MIRSNTARIGFREIQFYELAHALEMTPTVLRPLTRSRAFPEPIGRRGGERVWRLGDVADWLERSGWPADATVLRNWGG